MENIFEQINKKTQDVVSQSTSGVAIPPAEEVKDDVVDITQTVVGEKVVDEKKSEDVIDDKHVVATDIMDFEFNVEKEKPLAEISNTEQLYNELNKMFDTEFKSPGDILNLASKVKTFETKEKEFEQVELKAKDIESLLVSLPSDIILQIQDYVNGKDYRETIKSIANSTDIYTKPSSSYSKEELVLLHNSELTSDDLDDYDEKTMNSLYKSAKAIHDAKYNDVQASATNFMETQTKYASQYVESVDNSIKELKKKFPNIKGDTIKDVHQVMKKGLNAELFDDKGVYKDNAAELYMFGKHGLKVIEQLKAEFQKELTRKIKAAESKAKEEVVSETTNDKITKQTSVIETADIKEALKKSMPYLS